MEGLKKVEIDSPKKNVQIGKEAKTLATLIVEFKELFVWKPNDMSGISKDIITHEINIDLNIRSIAQKRRPVRDKKAITIRQELGKLVDVNFVKEIRFQT